MADSLHPTRTTTDATRVDRGQRGGDKIEMRMTPIVSFFAGVAISGLALKFPGLLLCVVVAAVMGVVLALGAVRLGADVPMELKSVSRLWLTRYLVGSKIQGALSYLSSEELSQLDEFSKHRLADLLSFATEIAAEADIPAQVNVVERHPNSPQNIVAIDIGGTRTKFLVARQWSDIFTSIDKIKVDGSMKLMPALNSSDLWEDKKSGDANGGSISPSTAFDTVVVAERIRSHLERHQIDCTKVHRVVFSVPGTVELAGVSRDRLTVVKNMPSFSRRFRGLDFQKTFESTFPGSKISALSDNMGAALGVACMSPKVKCGLVLVLGTAPAVATFFRDPSGKDKYIETGIWQSWVWFSKIQLDDPYGYCGGIKTDKQTGRIVVKPPSAHKIPHRQARIRFALDNNTWLRFMGRNPHLDKSIQPPLDMKDATRVWTRRLQSSINKLAEKFHDIYGPPEVVYVLGGNATRCHGMISCASYETTDHAIKLQVPVIIPKEDNRQQLMHMAGLVFSTQFKVKQVFAPGQDPLARGWTRGGEICMWVKRKEFRRKANKAASGTGGGGADVKKVEPSRCRTLSS